MCPVCVDAGDHAPRNGELALAGDALDLSALQARASRLGDIDVVALKAVPMDKRHNSKADYARLRKILGKTLA